VAYLRVSTDEQRLGPEAQREAIGRWAQHAGATVVVWHHEHGVSGGASLDERATLLAAVQDLTAHDAGLFVVAKRDRLARDVIAAAMIEQLVSSRGARVVSAAGEGTDSDEPTALLLRRMVDAFAEYERALIRARTRAALGAKKSRGELVGKAPFGSRARPDGVLEPDPTEQQVVSRVRALRAQGLSLRRIVAQLAHEGVVGRSGSALRLTQIARLLHPGARTPKRGAVLASASVLDPLR
jgi:DNA invertase Pin-like site-specific DNA recombinase